MPTIEELYALFGHQEVPPPPPCGVGEIKIGGKCQPASISRKEKRPINQAMETGDGKTACGCQATPADSQTQATPAASQTQGNTEMEMDTHDPLMQYQTGDSACVTFRGWGLGKPVSLDASPCSKDGCNPGTPRGLWAIPATVTVPAGPGTFVLELSTPRDANLVAFVVERVSGPAISLQTVSPFATRANPLTYPEWGTGSTVPNPNTSAIPALSFQADRLDLLVRQNMLPPWVPRYNLKDTNQRLTTTLTNADLLVAAVWDIILVVNYG